MKSSTLGSLAFILAAGALQPTISFAGDATGTAAALRAGAIEVIKSGRMHDGETLSLLTGDTGPARTRAQVQAEAVEVIKSGRMHDGETLALPVARSTGSARARAEVKIEAISLLGAKYAPEGYFVGL